MENKDTYHERGTIVFSGVDFFEVWALLMAKNYKHLASLVVNLSGDESAHDVDAIEKMLRERTRVFSHERIVELYGRGMTPPLWRTIFNFS